MKTAIILVSALLWLWFLGCTITWRIGRHLLVEGMGVRSIECGMLVCFTAGLLLYLAGLPAGRWVLAALLLVWLIAQFFSHEYYTLFGASPQKLAGYQQCFANTVKLFAPSSTRLIPDLYHIILHLLIAADLILVLLDLLLA